MAKSTDPLLKTRILKSKNKTYKTFTGYISADFNTILFQSRTNTSSFAGPITGPTARKKNKLSP